MTIRCPTIVAAIVALVVSGTPGRAQQLSLTSRLMDGLDRVEHGGSLRSAERDAFASVASGDELLDSLRIDGGKWIVAAPAPREQARRRLAAATFVLDVALTARDRTGGIPVSLIEWACDRLRETKRAEPAERDWWIATVGLLEDPGTRNTALPFHLAHASARFDEEPRFDLADAWVQAWQFDLQRHHENLTARDFFRTLGARFRCRRWKLRE